MKLELDAAKWIYRQAIDVRPGDDWGATWWPDVAAEVQAVVDAPSLQEAASVIDWWHHDWSAVGDTATDAARRIRAVAKRAASTH